MIITVPRIISDNDATLSTVSVDGVFECFGLEDEYRAFKIPAHTRIPAGRYRVGLRTFGGFHSRYAARFPEMHQGMLQIMDVPNFTAVLIHIGNTDEDTAGCLLVGAGCNTAGEITVSSSVLAYKAFYAKVVEAAANDDLWIEYIDEDLAAWLLK